MTALLDVILPVFLIIGFGYAAAYAKLFDDGAVDGVMRFAQNFAAPCLLFKSLAGVRMTHVPFKGVGPSVVALLGGEIDLTFASTSATLPHIKAQRLRALAVSTAARSPAVADLPTVAEAGVPGYQMNTWYGFFGPSALPKDLVTHLHGDITRAVARPDVRERMIKDGAAADDMPLEQFAAFIRADSARWAKVIREAGIRAE